MALTLDTIKDIVKDGIFFSSSRETIEYLLGKDLNALDEYVLLAAGKGIFLLNSSDLALSGINCVDYGSLLTQSDWDKKKAVCAMISDQLNGRDIFIDEKSEPVYYLTFLERLHNKVFYIGEKLYEESLIKTEWQIANIEKALFLNAAAYAAAAQSLREGISELDICHIVKCTYNRKAAGNIDFIGDMIAGVRTAGVSGLPEDYKIKNGDGIILDLLPRYNGIYCDTTRTLFLGEPTGRQRDLYQILTEAIEAGVKNLKPGICGEDVYFAVYNCLKKYGYEGYFPHHAGHGFGKTIYEAPYFLPGCRTELKENMTVTLEPGIYLPGQFGIRLENNYRITKDGSELLSEIPLEMEAFCR